MERHGIEVAESRQWSPIQGYFVERHVHRIRLEVARQWADVLKVYGRQPTRVLVGADRWTDLLEEASEFASYAMAKPGVEVTAAVAGQYLFGLEVVSAPWIRGICVTPP